MDAWGEARTLTELLEEESFVLWVHLTVLLGSQEVMNDNWFLQSFSFSSLLPHNHLGPLIST